MIFFAVLAVSAGALVSLSRQLNGRLALNTSAMESSFWNHFVGLVFILLCAAVAGGLFAGDPFASPWWAYLGGPTGVVFIAAGSWLVPRIGATQTGMLIIAGQMVSGTVIDLVTGAPGNPWARAVGVALVIAGMWVAKGARKPA